jgi:putative lipoic acid-binding regulatory protein
MNTTMPTIPPEQSLIEYPCAFPIKVMGAHVEGFTDAIVAVARQFDPGFNATSREQLDELYRTLSTHPMVKVVL